MTVKVSVILPTFNRSHSLEAAAKSVLNQSFKELELIIVDDGSTENVEEIVRMIDDGRVRFVRRNINGGAAAARNTGLTEAKGEYIAFQDSDDLWLPNKIKKQLEMFSTLPSNVGVVTGAKIIYGRDDRPNYGPGKVCYAPPLKGRLSLGEDQIRRLLGENRISLQTALFKSDCFPDRLWFDCCAKANEDWEFAVRLVQCTVIYEDPEPVVLAFTSSDSISKSPRKETLGEIRILKKNKPVLSIYKKQHSSMLLDISRYMYKSGKIKSSRKFLVASLFKHPYSAILVADAILGKLGRRLLGRGQSG